MLLGEDGKAAEERASSVGCGDGGCSAGGDGEVVKREVREVK